MEHWTKKVYKKITQKHVQNTFGHFWERFWAFLEFWNFFDFLKTFRSLDPPWNTGQKKFFEKSTPKTCSKHNWTLLGTNLGIFGILKIFWFFKNISKTRPSMEHWTKKVYKKFTQKHVQNTFGHFWERFWAFLEFWNFFDFLKTFRSLDPPWNTGQKKFFEKSTPKTCSKHNWTLLGTILGIFGLLKIFRFFENISKTRHSMEHWAKNFFEKVTPKTCSKHVWTLWEQFWAFLDFWKLFENIWKTRHSMKHWAKKNFRKKYPQNMFKTQLDNFGNDFGHFWNFENFFIY